jgi:hypothetical protein
MQVRRGGCASGRVHRLAHPGDTHCVGCVVECVICVGGGMRLAGMHAGRHGGGVMWVRWMRGMCCR